MTYITVKEASEKWKISERRVCILCSGGKVPGAVKKSKVWMIPENAGKPGDGRRRDAEPDICPSVLMLRCSEFEQDFWAPISGKARELCRIQNLFYSGYLEEAYADICKFIGAYGDGIYHLAAQLIRMQIAADLGMSEDYNRLQTFFSSLDNSDEQMNQHAIEKELICYYFQKDYTLDFDLICRENLYAELMPLISLISVRHSLNEFTQSGRIANLTNLEIVCNELDTKPNLLIRAYYHIILAVYYNALGMASRYQYHIRKATDILLERKWYTPLAEYSTTINLEFVKELDDEAYYAIMALSRRILWNYSKLNIFGGEVVEQPKLAPDLNLQIGFKIMQGKSNNEIARELGISQYKVKQHIADLYMLAGVSSRKEIKEFIIKNFYV